MMNESHNSKKKHSGINFNRNQLKQKYSNSLGKNLAIKSDPAYFLRIILHAIFSGTPLEILAAVHTLL